MHQRLFVVCCGLDAILASRDEVKAQSGISLRASFMKCFAEAGIRPVQMKSFYQFQFFTATVFVFLKEKASIKFK